MPKADAISTDASLKNKPFFTLFGAYAPFHLRSPGTDPMFIFYLLRADIESAPTYVEPGDSSLVRIVLVTGGYRILVAGGY